MRRRGKDERRVGKKGGGLREGQTKRGGQPNLFKAACEMWGRVTGQGRGGADGGMTAEGGRRKGVQGGEGVVSRYESEGRESW